MQGKVRGTDERSEEKINLNAEIGTKPSLFAGPKIMHEVSSNPSSQEKDLKLFLNSLGVKLPVIHPTLPNGYVTTPLDPLAASLLGSRDQKAVLLCYRLDGEIFPISIFFLGGDEEVLFCHSTLPLDSYASNKEIAPLLRKVA